MPGLSRKKRSCQAIRNAGQQMRFVLKAIRLSSRVPGQDRVKHIRSADVNSHRLPMTKRKYANQMWIVAYVSTCNFWGLIPASRIYQARNPFRYLGLTLDSSTVTMAHYDIFRHHLGIKYPAYGHALWQPSPGDSSPPVEVGDVGFIREGRFYRLFNVLLPADDPSHENFGVPEYHQQLTLQMKTHINSSMLSPNNFCSARVASEAPLRVLATGYLRLFL